MENRPNTDTDGLPEMLQRLGEAFAAGLSSSLSKHLRATVRVAALGVDRLPYRHFLLALDDVTCLGVLRVDPPGAQACVDIPLHLMRAMVERLLGGGSHAPGAAITEIERGMALQVIERVAAEFSRSASRMTGAELSIQEESLQFHPQSLRIMPEDEAVTLALFDLSVGQADHTEISGTVRLCLPDPVLEQLLDGAVRSDATGAPGSSRPDRPARDMLKAAAELRALLAETKLRLSDVLAMQVGDVITTERAVDSAVTVETDAGQSVTGQLGQFKGMRAVQMTNDASPIRSIVPSPAGGDQA